MSKELEALATIEELAFYLSVTNTPKNNKILAQADKILRQALKRNEPVTPIGVRHYNGKVKRGVCPVCRMETYSGDKYCCECGTKFDKDWSDEK